MNKSRLKIIKAFEFAYVNHAGSTRKGTQIPYIVHPIDVAAILMKNNASEDMIVAGLLHDVIEEENVELAEIERSFGKKIADLVNFVTEPKELRKSDMDGKKTWEARKQSTINKIKSATDEQKLLLCADKLANIRDIIIEYKKLGNELWQKFNAPMDKQRWYYRSLCKVFLKGEGISDYSVFNQFEECVTQIFP